jgi:hypothetical protein
MSKSIGWSFISQIQKKKKNVDFLNNSFRGNNCARAKMHLASMIIFKIWRIPLFLARLLANAIHLHHKLAYITQATVSHYLNFEV